MQHPSCPFGRIEGANIFHNLCLHVVAVVATLALTRTVRVNRVFVVVEIGIDSQRAHNRIFLDVPSIGVERQTQRHGDVLAFLFRIGTAAACQPVHPLTARSIVIYVVVLRFRVVVHSVGYTAELHEIARTLHPFRVTARSSIPAQTVQLMFLFLALCSLFLAPCTLHQLRRRHIVHGFRLSISGYTAPATAKSHGITRNQLASRTFARQPNVVLCCICREIERAQINPHAAAHLLIHQIRRLHAAVAHHIFGLVG